MGELFQAQKDEAPASSKRTRSKDQGTRTNFEALQGSQTEVGVTCLKATGMTALNTLAVAAVPAAQAVVGVASKIEAQSSVLASKVAGSKTKAKVSSAKRTVATKVARVRKAA